MKKLFAAALLPCLFGSTVLADSNPFETLALATESRSSSSSDIKSERTRPSDPFQEGSWVFTAYGSAAFGDDSGEVYAVHVGGGYYFIDGLSINLEAVGAFASVNDSGPLHEGGDSLGGGFDLLLRWHFLRDKNEGRWSIYADGGAGILYTGESIPANGSNFNFTPQIGLGATYKICDWANLMGGARWYHISNAGTHSDNPGYDSALVYLGVLIPF